MSDLPPEGSNPQQPEGSSGTPPAVPHWAVPAVPPAPPIERPASEQTPAPARTEIPAWANDPAVAQVPPHWAGPVAAAAAPVTAPAAIPTPTTAASPVAPAPAPGAPSPVANPPAGWYTPVAAPAPGSNAPTAGSPAFGQTPTWTAVPTTAAGPMARTFQFNRALWLPTFVVAAIIAGVTLGGVGLDKVIAAPSAGTVAVGGSVTITAASGWVLVSPAGDTSQGIQLQKGNAVLTAQVISTSYNGTSAAMVADAEQSLGGSSAQVSYGDVHHGAISGHDTTYVAFEATMTSGQQSGIVDGELVCMVVASNEVILVAAAPQGNLEPAIDDVSAMLKSVRARQ